MLVSKTTWHLFEAAFETILVIDGAGGRRGWRRRKSRRGGILPTGQPQICLVSDDGCYVLPLFPFSHCRGAGQGRRDDGEGAFLSHCRCWITHLPKLATWPAKCEVWWNDVKRYSLTVRLEGTMCAGTHYDPNDARMWDGRSVMLEQVSSSGILCIHHNSLFTLIWRC